MIRRRKKFTSCVR